MMVYKVLLLVCALSALTVGEVQKLKVSIYYETYCPCSVGFFTKEFYPAYKKLSEYLDVDLRPSGHTMYKHNGNWVFHCEHGDQECYGNKIHACAIAHISNPDQTMEFINCIIEGKYTSSELDHCANVTNITWPPIQQCYESADGDEIMSAYGNYNMNSIGFLHIPAVIFNNKYDNDLDENARKSFMATVCGVLESQAPSACLE